MKLCVNCLHSDSRSVEACPQCTGTVFAGISGEGAITRLPASLEFPCQGCFSTEHDLAFRYYRRVFAFFLGASIQQIAGYFCLGCRISLLFRYLGVTLITGWWGIAAVFYNTWAVLVGLWAVVAAPVGALEFGALSSSVIEDAAEENVRLGEIYADLPSWFEQLSEKQAGLVLVDADYYATLGISSGASQEAVKKAYRKAAKANHPDVGGDAGSEKMPEINDAYEVLGDPVLRHAYDNRHEVYEVLGRAAEATSGGRSDSHQSEGPSPSPWQCQVCGFESLSFEEVLLHAETEHPSHEFFSPTGAATRSA